MAALIVLLVLIAVVLVVLAQSVRIVPQARAGIVERLGRYSARSSRGCTSSSRSSTCCAVRSSTSASRW
jgi:regulator of protease activity HflC (stomatin/prohibitin superfamily)